MFMAPNKAAPGALQVCHPLSERAVLENGLQILRNQSQDPGGPWDVGEEPDLRKKKVQISSPLRLALSECHLRKI